jgi:putative hydrolase of the HAD superfamily
LEPPESPRGHSVPFKSAPAVKWSAERLELVGLTPKGRPRFDGVLLDLFGTLVPAGPRVSRAPHLHQMARILGADPVLFEREWAESFADRVNGRLGSLEETIRSIAGRQGVAPTPEGVRSALETRLAFTKVTLEACGPVLPSLDALRSAGVRLAVVSDCSEEPVRLWPSIALGRRIQTTVFSCVEGFCKPDRRMYARALERLGLTADRCAFVGDGGSRELSGAESAGLAAYQFRFPEGPGGTEARYDPDTGWKGVVLEGLDDLLKLDP